MAGFKAGGNISPAVFVKQDTTTTGQVLQCGAGDTMIGVSGPAQRYPPFGPMQDGYAAVSGQDIEVLQVTGEPADRDNILLQIGSGGAVARGDYLKSDASGMGVTTTNPGDWVGAQALESAAASTWCRVRLVDPRKY